MLALITNRTPNLHPGHCKIHLGLRITVHFLRVCEARSTPSFRDEAGPTDRASECLSSQLKAPSGARGEVVDLFGTLPSPIFCVSVFAADCGCNTPAISFHPCSTAPSPHARFAVRLSPLDPVPGICPSDSPAKHPQGRASQQEAAEPARNPRGPEFATGGPAMSTTTTTNTSRRLALAPKTGQRGRAGAGRRAVIVDGSLQVGDASRGGLKTSPSFSPAYLLAALEWAEDGENQGSQGNPGIECNQGSSRGTNKYKSHANFRPGGGAPRKPFGAPSASAHNKSAPNLRPRRRNDDVKKGSPTTPALTPLTPPVTPGPTAPRIDLLPEKLVFPSRKTPVSFLPTPSSISLDTAVKPVFLSSPISPGSRFPHREQYRHQQQQRPRTSNDAGRRRRNHDQNEASHSTSEVAQPDVETDRIFVAAAPQGHSISSKHAVYQSMQPSEAPPPSTKMPSPPRQPQGPVREAFAFLSRGRKKSSTGGSPHATLTKRSRTLPASATTSTSTSSSTGTDVSDYRQSPVVDSLPNMPRSSIEVHNPAAKVSGARWAVDFVPPVPTAALACCANVAIQSVSVRCRGTAVPVQVTKETSTTDLLLACSQSLAKLGWPINPDSCVVIEPCLRPGLERRLRQYELVWDVMSGWDHDSSNTLIILPDSSDPDRELSLSSVPKTLEEPAGFVLPLYFLLRPGKWAQRYITLKENGQIFASKKQDWKSTDKDVARLCHLSDFDLYLPTESEMRRQLRPPKRYCYAVRSQEKATLFEDSTHYVHFFCTEDPNVARQFRSCVHGWRSWYLVNKKLGLHEKKKLSSPTGRPRADSGYKGRASVDQGLGGRASVDQGSRARPLVDIPSTRSFPSSREGTPVDASPRSAIPPVPPLPSSLRENPAAVFAAGGLLGNGYEERKQQAARKDATTQRRGTVTSNDGPFVDGPNLLRNRAATAPTTDERPRTAGSDGSRRTKSRPDSPEQHAGWFPSALQHSAEQRTTRPAAPLVRRPSTSSHAPSRAPSTRQRQPPLPTHSPHLHHPPLPQQQHQQQQQQQPIYPPSLPGGPPQPLIDLTPTFVEAPQWSRENRGRGVRAPQGKPLVDLATGPPAAVGVSSGARAAHAPPPKSLVRRPEQQPPPLQPLQQQGGTLLERYEMQQREKMLAQRGRGNTFSESAGGGGGNSSGGGGLGGLGRRNTVRSNASGGVSAAGHHGGRPGTANPSPNPAAAYMQSRGRVMGVGDGEREKVRERLRSVDGRGRAAGRREY